VFDSACEGESRGRRGVVTEFTRASRRGLVKTAGALRWSLLGERVLITLTYPGEFPSNGRLVKQQSAWLSIVGSGDDAHLLAGTNVGMAWSKCIRYFAYAFKGGDDYQNRVPDGFERVGRFWGVWGSSPVGWASC